MASDAPLTRPLPGFAFKVVLENVPGLEGNAELYFKSVGGLKYETETVPVVAGGTNFTTYNLVGATKWSNIVLKRGFIKGSSLLALRNSWIYSPTKQRISGTIVQFDTQMLTQMVSWKFMRGWPAKWEISDFDASKSEMTIETLEIAHDGLMFG
jgi:phage tail-like protein